MATAQLESKLRVGLHRFNVAKNLVTRIWELDDKGAVLLVSRRIGIGFCHDDCNVSHTRRRTEPLFTIEHPFVTIKDCRGLHTRGIGTCRFFGH